MLNPEMIKSLEGWLIEPYRASGNVRVRNFPDFFWIGGNYFPMLEWERLGHRYYNPTGTEEERAGKIVLGQLTASLQIPYLTISITNLTRLEQASNTPGGMEIRNADGDFLKGVRLCGCSPQRTTSEYLMLNALMLVREWSLQGETSDQVWETSNNLKYRGY